VEICHGSPFDEDAYIFDELDAARALKTSTRPLCLFGHTHYPAVFELANDGLDSVSTEAEESALPLVEGSKYLVNPGSVGQPRDGDPRAAYGIVDESARWVELFRVKYAVNDAQTKIVKAGLPEVLAQRLTVGRYADGLETLKSGFEAKLDSSLQNLRFTRAAPPVAAAPRRTRRGGARSENPPDHHANHQDRRDEDEMTRCHRPPPPSD
jgi:diadenosine tetraphosphatase ApaH/serine/threonine PP2A family protein phosphatase